MPLGILFWVIWVVWVIFSFATRGGYVGAEYSGVGSTLLLMVLFGILGWQCFGPVVKS
jgi:hypothetical protein